MDINGDEVFMQIGGLNETFMKYDNSTHSLQFFNLTEDKYGFYEVTFNLTDSLGASAEYPLKIIVKSIFTWNPDEVEEAPKNITKVEETDDSDGKTCKGVITDISLTGNVTIFFNHNLQTAGINITDINSTLLDIYVDPAEGRDGNEDFKVETVNLTWYS